MANMTSNMAEALENSKAAAVSTRGIYPVTKASHVYKEDGTPLETPEEVEEASEELGRYIGENREDRVSNEDI